MNIMEIYNLVPTATTIAQMSVLNHGQAEAYFELGVKHRVANIFNYNALLRSFLKLNNRALMDQKFIYYLNSMSTKYELVANLHTYMTQIEFYLIKHDFAKIDELADEISKKKFRYDLAAVKTMMKISAKRASTSRLLYYYNYVIPRDCVIPDCDIYCILLSYYRRYGHYSKGKIILYRLLKSNIYPSSEHHKLIVQSFVADMITYFTNAYASSSKELNFTFILTKCKSLGYLTF